jgi:hypothetical protein
MDTTLTSSVLHVLGTAGFSVALAAVQQVSSIAVAAGASMIEACMTA